MGKLLRDPLFRRFVSASFFAGAFVWVAVSYFGVELDVVWVFLTLSFVFVGAMVVAGLLLAPVVRRFNSKPPLLARLSEEMASEDAEQVNPGEPSDRSS